ncbi:myelin-oligodendrocyte glycoprotein-like [Platysternon megacephalum]|uniref:Myelin-oligodendrocyte glycoprotein-like n=1 Tax=Platysternon megacephalum TaxID=55544 RepID=A0A4D9DS80_9SAUR|nr:myelin-oligodendrocyte glycoprotein-like [Platysternon megacephalum]
MPISYVKPCIHSHEKYLDCFLLSCNSLNRVRSELCAMPLPELSFLSFPAGPLSAAKEQGLGEGEKGIFSSIVQFWQRENSHYQSSLVYFAPSKAATLGCNWLQIHASTM